MGPNDTPSPAKRRRVSPQNDAVNDLLPGLPDHLAQVCLARLPPSTLFAVSRAWRRLLYAPSFPPFLALHALLSRPAPCTDTDSDTLHLHAFDPLAASWAPLPPPPLRLLLRHPAFLSRALPVQSLSVSVNSLVLIAATTHDLSPALRRPLVYDPLAGSWSPGPALASMRRWCAAGALRGRAYVASGVGARFSHHVARAAESWAIGERRARWERVPGLRDGRFSREAIAAVGWRGKLCVVDVVAREGTWYDVDSGAWGDLPPGMLAGWRGPAAAIDEEELFAVDDERGVLTRYVEEKDGWDDVASSDRLKGAEHVAAGAGKVCVVLSGGKGIAVVDVAGEVGRMWNLDPPMGFDVLALHILPRRNAGLV